MAAALILTASGRSRSSSRRCHRGNRRPRVCPAEVEEPGGSRRGRALRSCLALGAVRRCLRLGPRRAIGSQREARASDPSPMRRIRRHPSTLCCLYCYCFRGHNRAFPFSRSPQNWVVDSSWRIGLGVGDLAMVAKNLPDRVLGSRLTTVADLKAAPPILRTNFTARR